MQEITRDLTDYRIGLRDKILETAMAAFEKKGVKAVKMDDIATALSISLIRNGSCNWLNDG